MADVHDLQESNLKGLAVSPEIREALLKIQAELTASYRESFVTMSQAISRQASALERIQTTLELVLRSVAPTVAGQAPAVLRVAAADEDVDVASAVVVSDPIGSGFTLSLTSLSKAMGLSPSDVGILVRPLGLVSDGACAVVVRKGAQELVNYHPRAIERFMRLVASAPDGMPRNARSAVDRVRRKLAHGTHGTTK